MTAETGIDVLAAPAFDPGAGRIALTLPSGLTVAEIVAAAVPGLPGTAAVRVALATGRGIAVVPREHWHRVRPRPGVRVVIRVIPGKNALRAVLSIVVSIAAVALGGVFAGALGFTAGTTGFAVASALGSLAVTTIGNLLINALIPPVRPDPERRDSPSISGWRNRADPDGAVPVVLGSIRMAPPFAALSHTEIAGDLQYVRALFLFGEGRLDLTDFRIGETSIADFDEVEIEVREGAGDDDPVTLYPQQVVEETIGVELTRPLPRDDLGDPIAGEPATETPVVRTAGADATGAAVILAWPGGLVAYNDEGKRRGRTVRIRIEQRPVQAEEWQPVTELAVTARKAEGFYRQHGWTFPSRGRWQVRLTMLTDETEDGKVQQRTVWAALQTLRPEYPLDHPHPLALVAVRVKATHQLNGALDSFSARASRLCLDWDHEAEAWVERATSNPASLFRFVLQAAFNPKPVPDAGIDLPLLEDWHGFCRLRGLHYNRVMDRAGTTLRDALTEIAAAGRASPRHDGLRWGVVIDRPQDLVVDHISPRNSRSYRMRRTYADLPHGFVVKFQDETNDFREAQRVIRRPGHEGPILLTETLGLPGLTDPATVWREGLRRFHEAMLRPDRHEVTQDGALRVATRGDLVMLSHDVLSRVQRAARVAAVEGRLVELDDPVRIGEAAAHAIRFRVFADAEDTVGTSVVRNVTGAPGETAILTLAGEGPVPVPGMLVHFGEAGQESFPLVVTEIEATEDQGAVIRAVDAAPAIDALTDAAEVPPWSGRAGAEIGENLAQPPAPRFVRIASGVAGTDDSGRIEYLIEPGSGPVATAGYEVGHRAGTSGDWTVAAIPAADGGGAIDAYDAGDTVQLRARALSPTGVAGPWTAAVTLLVGAGDAAIPAALDPAAIAVTAVPGGVVIQLATGPDAATARIRLYRSTSATLDRATDGAGEPHPVAPLQSYSFALGDTSRTILIADPGLDAPGAWSAGTGWTVAGGVAAKAPGTQSAIGQAAAPETGKWYRLAFTVAGRTAGTVRPRFTGGTVRAGTAVNTNARHLDRIQTVSGNNTIEWLASSTFDGTIDDLVLFLETAACLPAGTHRVWIEPQNVDGVPGPVAGPFTIEVP